nr:unnamed protein product [Digitaria exilis]
MSNDATMNFRNRWLMSLSCLRMSRCSRRTLSTPERPSSTSSSRDPANSSSLSPWRWQMRRNRTQVRRYTALRWTTAEKGRRVARKARRKWAAAGMRMVRTRKRSHESAAWAGEEWSMHTQRRQERNHWSSSSGRDAHRSITPRFSADGSSGSAAAAAAADAVLDRRPMVGAWGVRSPHRRRSRWSIERPGCAAVELCFCLCVARRRGAGGGGGRVQVES